VAEEVAVDLILTAGGVILGGAEVLEGAETGDGVEGAEVRGGHVTRIAEVHLEAVAPAGLLLRAAECDADAPAATVPDVGE
jgi:hypothetical protein